MWIIVILAAVLIWQLGWLGAAILAALFVGITAGVAIYDKLSHDRTCRWCNRVKRVVAAERRIATDRVTTRHGESFPTHLWIHVSIDGVHTLDIDMDFNEQILAEHEVERPLD